MHPMTDPSEHELPAREYVQMSAKLLRRAALVLIFALALIVAFLL